MNPQIIHGGFGGSGARSTAVTIHPVDGGFIVEWIEMQSRSLPPLPHEESWRSQNQKIRVPFVKQAVREKLDSALKLMESIVRAHVEKIRKGGGAEEEADPFGGGLLI